MDDRREAFLQVHQLAATGLSDYQIATRADVPRSTVQRWRHRDKSPTRLRGGSEIAAAWEVPHAETYSYLLGNYLGDGHLVHKPPNGWLLRITSDRRYGAIEDEIMRAMEMTFPGRRAVRSPRASSGADVLQIAHPAVGRAFPQHGPGRKHLRSIVLEGWQLELTRENPGSLIRGLIHSDGCRAENQFRTKLPSGRVAEYSYVRYFFSNLSADIRAIFVEHCELLGVRVTQSNHRNLSISHRTSVAILDSFVGPKY